MKRVTSVATPIAHLIGPGKIKVANGHLAFVSKDAPPQRLDPRTLDLLFCYGPVGVTDDAFTVLFQNQVQVAWMTPGGNRCRGRLFRSDPPNTWLRLLQFDAFLDPGFRIDWARTVVAAKIDSQIQAARHYQRHGSNNAADTIDQLRAAQLQTNTAGSLAALRGIEGTASAAWFRLFASLLQTPWHFAGRCRRPPRDPVNALLSLGYTFLHNRIVARCEAAGLETYLGGLHAYRPGRPSLACDLVEPLRIPAVDRWVLVLCNQNRIAPHDFRRTDDGGFRLHPDAFSKVLLAWEEYRQENTIDDACLKWIDKLIRRIRSRPCRLHSLRDENTL